MAEAPYWGWPQEGPSGDDCRNVPLGMAPNIPLAMAPTNDPMVVTPEHSPVVAAFPSAQRQSPVPEQISVPPFHHPGQLVGP